MNNTIYKYPLKVTDVNRLELPKGAIILCIQLQKGTPCLWAQVDANENEKEVRIIETIGTGNPMKESPRSYIGTYQLHEGMLVFHVFEYLGMS